LLLSTAADEESLFRAAGVMPMAPAQREQGMLQRTITLPGHGELIGEKDIRGIIHCHSNWSDGTNTLEEMAAAAIARGYEYLVISDHSQSAFYAQGLKPEKVREQHLLIGELNEKFAPFRIFRSIESDILSDGSLDYSNELLSTFDLVIASVHSNLKMTLEKAMSRIETAICNPYTNILGHPTGRLLLSREGYPVDHERILGLCREREVVVELNSHPSRLDLDWTWIARAQDLGLMISIDPDAHSIKGFEDIRYGVLAAQKGGLSPRSNLSSLSREAFTGWLEQRKKRARNG
ncbi:MAG TPA: PHP domain-containing protein, partial [Chitinophagaceae bacterium]|nr:PHP domain-containing protein [Chitinophagaceae bacterium]